MSQTQDPEDPEDDPTEEVSVVPAEESPPPGRAHPGVAGRYRRTTSADPWGFVVRAMAYETLVVLVTAASVAALVFLASLILFQGQLQDAYLRLRGAAPVSGEVVVLTIGPEALYLYNPDESEPEVTPRRLLTEVVGFLDEAGASVIVLDFLLDRPSPDDPILAAAAQAHGAVLAAERFQITEPASGRVFTPGIPPTLEAAMGSGFANFQEEPSALLGSELLVRRLPLVQISDRAHLSGSWPMNQLGSKQDIDQAMPALALAAAWWHTARKRDPDAPLTDLARLLAEGCTPLTCEIGTPALGLPSIPLPLSQPHDINFRGPEGGDGLVTIDAARVLRVLAGNAILAEMGRPEPLGVPQDLRAQIEGRIVVVGRVGTTSSGHIDRFVTPYSLPVQGQADMSGPRIHAHVIDTLLTGRHIRHSGSTLSWLLALVTGTGVIVSYQRLSDTLHGALWLTVTATLITSGFVLFRFTDGFVVDIGPAVAACLVPAVFLHLRGWVREQAGLPR